MHAGDRWYFENHEYGGPGFVFTLEPRTMEHFTTRCHELQTLPESGFVRTTVCHRLTDDGMVTLRSVTLRRVTAQGMSEEVVENLAAYEQLLNTAFDLHLPDTAPLWEKSWARHQAWLLENP
jgi:arylamine N-acetyltransferase